MSSFVVGYRDDDPRRHQLVEGGRAVGRCEDCRHHVYYAPSGQDAYRTRDSRIICAWCYDRQRSDVVADL